MCLTPTRSSCVRYIDHMVMVSWLGSKSFCTTFLNTEKSYMYARSCNVYDESSLRNIITLMLYSKQTSRCRLHKETTPMKACCTVRSAREFKQTFGLIKHVKMALSTANRHYLLARHQLRLNHDLSISQTLIST